MQHIHVDVHIEPAASSIMMIENRTFVQGITDELRRHIELSFSSFQSNRLDNLMKKRRHLLAIVAAFA